jgi:hypothetical protein
MPCRWVVKWPGFGVIAVGAADCVVAGQVADRIGRTIVTIESLVVSGSCALTVGFLFAEPGVLTALCLMRALRWSPTAPNEDERP